MPSNKKSSKKKSSTKKKSTATAAAAGSGAGVARTLLHVANNCTGFPPGAATSSAVAVGIEESSQSADADYDDEFELAGAMVQVERERDGVQYAVSNNVKFDEREEIYELFAVNMEAMYREASWGYDEREKREELSDLDARYLLIREEQSAAASSSAAISSSSPCSKLEAFVHFRYCSESEEDDDEVGVVPVLYVYEIQVAASAQGKGLGKKLMLMLESIAHDTSMKKVMLTVFESNAKARGFYERIGYGLDESSPLDEDYHVLSKRIGTDVAVVDGSNDVEKEE
jgi:ribosomal protein S18 acetylase RimI-like enzyme